MSWAARSAQLGWILNHQDDLDADFLAIYGIDLEEREIGSRRYVQLAQRLTAYQGVMAARIAAEDDIPSETSAPRAGTRRKTEELELQDFHREFPDIVSVTRVTD